MVIIAFFTDFYYNVILAWSLYLFFVSFTPDLPWTRCNNTWNTVDCYDGYYTRTNVTSSLNVTLSPLLPAVANMTSCLNCTDFADLLDKRKSPALEYFE